MTDTSTVFRYLRKAALPALICFCGILTDLRITVSTEGISPGMLFLRNVLRSFALTNPLRFIILPALICFFALILYRLDGPLFRKSTVIPAVFGSLFTIIGYSFATQENWDLVVTSFPGQWLKVIFAFVGYATLFLFLAAFLFEVTEFFAAGIADSRLIPPRPERAHPLMERWNASFKAHPFRNTFLIF